MSLENTQFETLLYERRGSIIVVTLNRPEQRNAIIPKMRRELQQVWQDFKMDDDLHVSVLTGAGDDFCIGGDDDDSKGPARDVSTRPLFTNGKSKLSNRDEAHRMNTPKHNECWKPFIVAINGACSSGALHFLVDSDIALCSDDATFWDTHTGRESVVVWEILQMARRIPYVIASRMALMAEQERLDARRALEVGLVTEVVPKAQLRDRAIEIAEKVAKNDINALMGTIESLWKGQDFGMFQAIKHGLLIRQVQQYNLRLARLVHE